MSHLLIHGNALRIPLPDSSVHCVVTSPPYWGLRDYSTDGQLGLEETPKAYLANMTAVFREVRRVLRSDGCAWVNMGDSYAAGGMGGHSARSDSFHGHMDRNGQDRIPKKAPPGLKPKDLCGIPWRLALALQADGWWLRSDVIWSKPNPMPESVTDRPTKAHEYIFLLTKSERYFYDAEGVKEKTEEITRMNNAFRMNGSYTKNQSFNNSGNKVANIRGEHDGAGRNLRSVWTITPQPFAGQHFATMPVELASRCIKAGTSEHGACSKCGKPWERVVEPSEEYASKLEAARNGKDWYQRSGNGEGNEKCIGNGSNRQGGISASYQTLGFRPACSCSDAVPVPCVVLDPFIGSGTTIVAALALGRHAIGLDLSTEYLGIAQRRIDRPHAPIVRNGRQENHPLFREIE